MGLDKIKGPRLDPQAHANWHEKMAENINGLETKVNEIIDLLREKGIA